MGHPAGPTTPAPDQIYTGPAGDFVYAEAYRALLAENERLRELEALIRDDSYAITFQTMGQYRTALLRALRSPSTEDAPSE